MKSLMDPVAKKYLVERTGLSGEELNLVGNSACLTAYYGDLLSFEQFALYLGMSKNQFRKKLQNAVDTVYFVTRVLETSDDARLWLVKPGLGDFIYAMAAGIVSDGFYPESCSIEPADRRFAREWLNHFFLPGAIRSARPFRGYLAVLEYLTVVIWGDTSLSPIVWVKQRYGAKSTQLKDIRDFLHLSWDNRASLNGVASLFEGKLDGGYPKATNMLEKMGYYVAQDWKTRLANGKAF